MARVVLVTGASGGIGAAAASAFAVAGDSVVLGWHRNKKKAQVLCQSMNDMGCAALAVGADVVKENEVENLFKAAEEKFGPVEVLVNAAGFAQQKLFTNISSAEWDHMFAVHVKGSFLCCRRALPDMIRKRNGCIVNVASMWGQVGGSCEVHYSAAKAAVIGMTKALAKEVGPSSVRVNCVAPGAINTNMLSEFSQEDMAALAQEMPLGRLGTPAEVAGVIRFLASSEASYVTGQVVSPNGGFVV